MKSEQFTVLIVDDNPADRLIYRMWLTSSPGVRFQVFEAEWGQAGLDFCKAQLPDCILLDFNMPDMDGLRFVSRLKEQFGDLPCAVVMLTGIRDERVAVRAMKSGITDYLAKTENIGEVLAHAVASAIEKSQMRRQIAEQQVALEASELQYRTLMESLPQLVWLADSGGELQFVNRRWSEYTGLKLPGDFGLQDLLLPEDRERFAGFWQEAVGANRGFEMELRLRRTADSNARWHLIRLTPIQARVGETRWLGCATDIEDLKQAEMAVQKKQKWESIGLLAGGIAHDFNNLLVGVLGGATLLAEMLPASDGSQSTLNMIIQSSERAAYLTRQLLAYSGKGQLSVDRVDLSKLVRETCELMHSSIPRNVQLTLRMTDPMPVIEADAVQMQQIITNLLMNAAEAIPGNQRGTITVRTSIEDGCVADPALDISGPNALHAGSCAVLEVQDSGIGMDAETKAKIFDPFFTTKFLGRGLGLAAVQGIVRSAQGRIDVESVPGRGTTVRVFLPIPLAIAAPERPSPRGRREPEQSAAEGTVLVIEGEASVRKMMSVTLERAGYEVVAAEDGPAGLAILEQQKESVSLVLLEMRMAPRGGDAVLRKIRECGCRAPVMICSDDSEAEVMTEFARRESSGFIQKPFKRNELIRCVGVLLKSVPAGREC